MSAWVQPTSVRVLGVVLVVHGLAHGVLPLRGAGILSADPWVNGLATSCYTIALIGFVTAGMGALGVRPFDRLAWWVALIAVASSMIAFRMLGDMDLWPGMLLDLLLGIGASSVETAREPAKQPRPIPSGCAATGAAGKPHRQPCLAGHGDAVCRLCCRERSIVAMAPVMGYNRG